MKAKPPIADAMFHGKQTPADQVWVVFDTPGVPRRGTYRNGAPALVDAAEAERLIAHKGFRTTTAPASAAAKEN